VRADLSDRTGARRRALVGLGRERIAAHRRGVADAIAIAGVAATGLARHATRRATAIDGTHIGRCNRHIAGRSHIGRRLRTVARRGRVDDVVGAPVGRDERRADGCSRADDAELTRAARGIAGRHAGA